MAPSVPVDDAAAVLQHVPDSDGSVRVVDCCGREQKRTSKEARAV